MFGRHRPQSPCGSQSHVNTQLDITQWFVSCCTIGFGLNALWDSSLIIELQTEGHFFDMILLFSSARTSWMSSRTRAMTEPRHQQASTCQLQLRAHPQNGRLLSWVASQHREWEPSCRLALRGHDPVRPRWWWRECGELAARPTQERAATTTRITAIWWGWVASWERAKCRTSAIGSTSSSARAAGKSHPLSIPGVRIVLDELADTSRQPQQVFRYEIYLSLRALLVAYPLELMWSIYLSQSDF